MEVLARVIKEKKESKRIQIRRKKSHISPVYRSHDPTYRKTKNFPKWLLELIRETAKTIAYKINTHKSKAYLYINNSRAQKESWVPFTKATENLSAL